MIPIRRQLYPCRTPAHDASVAGIGYTAEQKHWFQGLPSTAVPLTDMNGQKHWFQGLPGPSLVN